MLTILAIFVFLNVVVFIGKSWGAGPASRDVGLPAKPASQHCASARKGLRFYIRATNEWRYRMGTGKLEEGAHLPTTCPHVRHQAAVWRARASAARIAFRRWWRGMDDKWGCIHRHEGAWNANTGNGYWGGLQMTRAFQQAHGPEFYWPLGRGPHKPEVTADKWPPWAQVLAAEDAWRDDGRSFREWGTAGMCGLA